MFVGHGSSVDAAIDEVTEDEAVISEDQAVISEDFEDMKGKEDRKEAMVPLLNDYDADIFAEIEEHQAEELEEVDSDIDLMVDRALEDQLLIDQEGAVAVATLEHM